MDRVTVRHLALSSCIVLFLAVTSFEAYGQGQEYTDMILAIENWLESRPRPDFASTEQEQVFRWKVAIEQAGYDSEDRFLVYQALLKEIGDKEFTYQHMVYNATSIRAFMLETYPFGVQRSAEIPRPDRFWADMYSWYQGHVSSKAEQMRWLEGFLSFLSHRSGTDVDLLIEDHYDTIRDAIVQYLALLELYLSGEIRSSSLLDVYQTTTTFLVMGDAKEMAFHTLAQFANSDIASKLARNDKDMILAFVVPKYAHYDAVVRIYAALSK